MLTTSVLAFWLVASPLPRQVPAIQFPAPQPISRATKPRSNSLKWPTIVYASSLAADYATTAQLMHYGGIQVEKNPLSQWTGHPVGVIAAGVAADTATVLLWNKYVGRKHPKVAKIGLYVASGVRFYLAARNAKHFERWRQYHRKFGGQGFGAPQESFSRPSGRP
jgi:hypothetical protein